MTRSLTAAEFRAMAAKPKRSEGGGSLIHLHLPFPPSVWELYEGWGKSRHRSKTYTKWIRDAGYFIRGKHEMITVPFHLHICLKRPNKRVDIDNRAKGILDLLQHYAIIKNDNLCETLTMQWDAGIDAECVVLICPAEEAMAA